MPKPMELRFRLFASFLGKMLIEYGFPEKIRLANYCFERSVDEGVIGLFVIPRYSGGNLCEVELRVAVSLDAVQSELVKTEYYIQDSKVRTWTFGCGLAEIKYYKQNWFQRKRNPYPDRYFRFSDEFSDDNLKEVATWAFRDFEKFGWPYLRKCGLDSDRTLRFLMSMNEIVPAPGLSPSKKWLAAMIFARHLGRQDLFPHILERARKQLNKFKDMGNHDDIARFERVRELLGLPG